MEAAKHLSLIIEHCISEPSISSVTGNCVTFKGKEELSKDMN